MSNDNKLNIPDCKNFTGYKPCKPYHNCLQNGCIDNKPFGEKILIINLDAMGDVLMTTAQLPAIKRKFPVSSIFWITLKNALPLITNNPYIDFPLEWNIDNILLLQNIELDYIYNADKNKNASALLKSLKAKKEKYGFTLNENGVIIPQNEYANYNYLLGCDDNLKFKINKKTGEEILAKTWNLEYKRDRYVLNLTESELTFTNEFRNKITNGENKLVIGFNTGCSNLYPNKKFTLEQLSYLISELIKYPDYKVLLLGGPEDTERNNYLSDVFRDKIVNTPTTEGLRKGLCYINSCDIVITGDSFGMHAAIALQKYVLAWFGLSCQQEIDLFDYGKKFYDDKLECSPCWKKVCPYDLECRKNINLNAIINEVHNFYELIFKKR